ncbi:hypothetical protein G6L37_34675 [Agrobacterium rubi]|nr:hypothetical protein [Agrobacterium rubi]NTF23713.1 hypothetical protein [Agrobacterium rubi]
MFFTTVAAWFVAGIFVTFLTFVLEGWLRRSIGYFIFSALIVAFVSAGLAWCYMTVFSPYLLGTWVQLVVIAGVSVVLRCLPGDVTGRSIATYSVGFVLLIAVGFFTSAPLFNAQQYGSLMVPEIKERDETVPLVDQTQARVVTDELAVKRAAEVLASAAEAGLGSRVRTGGAWGNKVRDTMYWVMPLEHSGFGKWMSNGTTPGFIAVSQMNEMVTKFVQDKPLKIGEDAWFDDNIYRHLFNRGFKSQIMGTAIFQVDDDWNPYWIVPMYLPQVGIGGEMPVSWSIVNAMTGDVQTYNNEAAVPAWVDRLYHQDMIAERFNDWGCWSKGVWACMVSGNDVIVTTPGINVTIDAALDIVYYSGTQFQNNKSEGATSGFFTANARTGKVSFYRRAGISEEAAKAVMNGAYADFDGYRAADNVLLSLNGREAYFSVIVDGNGSRKGFALVLRTNRNVYGKGNSIQAALTDFSRSMQRAGSDAGFSSATAPENKVYTGIVKTITSVVQNDRTSFYLTLDTIPHKIIEVSEEKIGEIVMTKVGDRVQFTTDNEEPEVVTTTLFDNNDVVLAPGPIEEPLPTDSRQSAYEEQIRKSHEAVEKSREAIRLFNKLMEGSGSLLDRTDATTRPAAGDSPLHDVVE